MRIKAIINWEKTYKVNLGTKSNRKEKSIRRKLDKIVFRDLHLKKNVFESNNSESSNSLKISTNQFFECTAPINKLTCHKCLKFESNFLVELREHIQKGCSQVDIKTIRYLCRTCNFKTYSKYLLIRHSRLTLHKGICKESSHTQHVIFKHKESSRKFECDFCDYRAKYNKNLKEHILVKHTNEDKIKWFHCFECGYKAKLKYSLKLHIKNNHGRVEDIKSIKCDQCSRKVEITDDNLENHSNSDETTSFKCKHCDFKSEYKASYKRHLVIKHGIGKNIQTFKCPHCHYIIKFNDHTYLKYT